MIVRVHRGQLDYFRRMARHNPNEIYALLLGKKYTQHLCEVHKFFYPDLDESTPNSVTPDAESVGEAFEYAEENGLQCLGTIHSHPDYIPVLSPDDHFAHRDDKDLISGVVGIMNKKTYVCFWKADSSLRCHINYF